MQINWLMQHFHSLIAPILVFEAHKVISFQDTFNTQLITNGKRERENLWRRQVICVQLIL